LRAVIQRVREARVECDGVVLANISSGALVFLALAPGDTLESASWILEKILKLRLFNGPHGGLELSLEETGFEILLVSQFTLYADLRKGTRPSFSKAMPPLEAEPLFAQIASAFCERWPRKVQCGRFGADMQVHLVNDGPITLILDKDSLSS